MLLVRIIFPVKLIVVICVSCLQLATAEDLQISSDDAARFNDESKQEAVDAANTAIQQVPDNAAQEEIDRQKRGTGELFNTKIQQ